MSLGKLRLLKKWNGRDGWYEITPAIAAELLERAAKNRPLKEWRAQQLAAEIGAGQWRANGESVVFDERGRLIDGQHRLRACVLAGRAFVVYCIFDVSGKVFPSFDQGAARNGGDLASLMGFDNSSAVAAVATLAIDYEDRTIDKTGKRKLPPERRRSYMDRHRDRITAAVTAAIKYRNGLEGLVPLSHAAFTYYMVSEQNNGLAEEFLEKLATGTGLNNGDALLLFRKRMTALIGEKHKMAKAERVALLIKAWNAFIAGKKVGVLRWRSDVETFPAFGKDAEEA